MRREGTSYVRKRVPKLHADSLGETELKIGLETKDLHEALAKLPGALVESKA
jgi:hypothetical protein